MNFRNMGAFALILILCANFGFAQTPATDTTPVATNANGYFQPAYYIGGGGTYDYYGKTGFAAETEFGVRIGSTPIYSYTTLEFGAQTATIRTGAAYMFYQSGNFNLVALGDAGLATGSVSPALASFSGGGMVMYDIGNRVTNGKSHFYLGFGGRMVQTASLGSQPVAIFTLGHGL